MKRIFNKLIVVIIILIFIIGIICIVKGEQKDRTENLYKEISNRPYMFETDLINQERNGL